MFKRKYIMPLCVPTDVELESAILDGSIVNVSLKVENVIIEEFSDGFADSATSVAPGFQDVSFD